MKALRPERKKHQILLLLPLHLRYGRDIARGIAETAQERGWLLAAANQKEPEFVAFVEAHAGEYEGVIGSFADAELMRRLRKKLPAVNVSNRTQCDELPQVISDDVEIGRLAAGYFLAKGYRHYAGLGFAQYLFSIERLGGFREELARRGYSCDEYNWAEMPLEGKPAHFARWLSALPRPLALFAANDAMARYAVQSCRLAGLDVPQEVAILGVDDDETESLLAGFPLSSVQIPFESIGRRAAEMLARLLRGEPPPPRPALLPPTGVAERRSTDVMAVEDEVLSEALRFARDAPAVSSTIRAAAAHVGLSVRALQYRCRRRLGRRFHAVVLDMRLDRARRMLLESNRRVSEIAKLCGMGGAAQLGRAFRRRYGCTPTELRRRAEAARNGEAMRPG